MEITVKSYYLNLKNESDAAEYAELKKELKERGLKKFCAISTNRNEISIDGVFTIDPDYLFSNQSNTKEGARIFDHYQEYMPTGMNKSIRRGHYIKEGYVALAELRAARVACGYCGKQYDKETAPVICPACQDSPYLSLGDLHLLKVAPIGEKRQPLTEDEAEKLKAAFVNRQITSAQPEDQKARKLAGIAKTYHKALDLANVEYKGFLWLLDRGVNTENCIFYESSKTFCFGWRSALDPEVVAGLKAALEHFPFNLEFKEN